MKKITNIVVLIVAIGAICSPAVGESKKNYLNRARLMLDLAVRTNEYVRQRLQDKELASFAHAMAEKNVSEAEKMTPPSNFGILHPHLLLVLENTERALAYAEQGELAKYRKYQRTLKKELQLLEAIAQRERIDLYIWGYAP